MPFEQLGRSLMRIRANDHVGANLITCIFDAALGDFFGLAERSAHTDDCGLMFFGPRLPSRYPFSLLLAFPTGRYDDQVDSVSQFLKWSSQRDSPFDLTMISTYLKIFVGGVEIN